MGGELHLSLIEDGADEWRLDQLTRHLRDELLLQLDVAASTPLSGPPALVVPLGDGYRLLPGVVALSLDWLRRSLTPLRTLRLEVDGDVLDLPGHPGAAERFILRHTER